MIMIIKFGENLKRLRTQSNLTQEDLASVLGVSFQTISKWERGETYPDLTMLPEIAAYFNISADDLLGADEAQKERKIKYYLELFNNMQLKDVSCVLDEYRKAVKDFPNNYQILINYMELLHIEKGSVQVKDYKPLSDELVFAYDKIQRNCTEDSIRIRSKHIMIEHLMWQYQCLGWLDDCGKRFDEKYKKQAEEIFKTLPSLSDTREYLSLDMDVGSEYEPNRKAIEELSYLLQNAVIGYCYYTDGFTAERRIEIINSINGIFKLIDTDDSPTKNRIHIIYNYGHLGHLYAEIGDNENALAYLNLAAEEAIKFDLLPDAVQRTALFYEQEIRFRNMSMRERMYELITKHYPLSEDFKAQEKFKEIAEKLK